MADAEVRSHRALVCYLQQVQVFQNGQTIRMVAVVKQCCLLVQVQRGCREICLKTTIVQVLKKILACLVSPEMIIIP